MQPIRAIVSLLKNLGIHEFGPISRLLTATSTARRRRGARCRRGSSLPKLLFTSLEPRAMLSGNTGMEFSITPAVNENGVVTLTGDLGDGPQDDISLHVDWGDDSNGAVFSIAAGTTSFSTTHRYLDDDPTLSSSDNYSVSITITDEDGQTYTPAPFAEGPSFSVNATTANHQTTEKLYGAKTVASDANGNFIITWSSLGQDGDGYGIYAQRFDSSGSPVGSEIQINATIAGDQKFSSVAMDSAGNFVVTWTSSGQDAAGDGVYARRFDGAGNPLGNEIQVNTEQVGDQQFSSVAMDASGNFVIVWSSADQDGSGVFAQRYNSSGDRVGPEFQVNSDTASEQSNASLAMNESGEFVVTWSSLNSDGFSSSIYGQRYNSSGVAAGSQFRIDDQEGSIQDPSSVAINNNGDVVVSWSSFKPDGSFNGVFARQFGSNGNPLGASLEVAAATGQLLSSVALDDAGNFTVVWDSLNPDGLSSQVFAQRYDVAGNTLGSQIQISDGSSFQTYTSIANSVGGGFIVNWSSVDPTWTNWDVNARQFTVGQDQSEFELDVAVNNVPPTFGAGPDVTLSAVESGQFGRSVTFFDVGSLDDHTITVNYGDGTGDQTIAADAANTFDLSHVFTTEGTYTVAVSVEDDDLGLATDSFDVTVVLNTAPTAIDDVVNTNEEDAIVFDVLASNGNGADADAEGNIDPALTVLLSSPPAKGLLTNNGDGTFEFDPNGEFESLVSGRSENVIFQYQIEDDGGLVSEATVTVVVDGVNDAPFASAVVAVVSEDGPSVNVSAVFSDFDAPDSHTFGVDDSGTLGVVTNNADGTFTYDPNGQFESLGTGDTAIDSFVYSVTDASGATSTATVRITILGQFDAVPQIVDGSFETEVPINGFGFVNPSTSEGWQSLNGEPLEIWESGFNGVDATDGDFFLELDAHSNQIDAIYQSLQTEAGQVYKLTFDIRSRSSNFNTWDETVLVDWNGQSLSANGYRANQAGQWTTITAYVVGTGGLDQLLFRESTSPGANDSTGPLLDDVRLERIYTLEAENMNRSGMVTRSASNASNSQLARLSGLGQNGALWTDFAGLDGMYEVSIFVQDESDGQSTVWLDVDGQNVESILLDRDIDGLGSDNGGFSKFVVPNVAVNAGDRISLLIDGDSGEYGRVDRIELHRTSDLRNSITIADEDFGSGATGWTNSQTRTSDSGERYLGGFGQTTTEIDTAKTFSIPQDAEQVSVIFDFLEIDSWDNETFRVQVNNSVYDLGTFYWNADETDERSWSVAPGIRIQTLGSAYIDGYGFTRRNAAYQNDFRHAFAITIEDPDDTLTVGFGSNLNHARLNETWGVDNLSIVAYTDAD